MKAIAIKEFGAADRLFMTEIPIPEVKSGEVLIEVRSISINPVDVKTRSGKALAAKLKADDPILIGWDVSGIVVQAADDVMGFKKGDPVFGMVNFPGHGKAYAEYVTAPADQLALKPENTSFEEAAAATLAALTAWQALTNHTSIAAGDRVLVHAASGGVGHFAIQLAKNAGAYVIGTSSAKNRDFVLGLGADAHIDYHAVDFEEVLTDLDFVLDTIGGDYIERSLKVIKKGGTIVSLPSGLNDNVVDLAKEKGVHGFKMMVQSDGKDMQKIAALLAEGKLRSHVSRVFKFDQMVEAHLQVEKGSTVGKVIVNVS